MIIEMAVTLLNRQIVQISKIERFVSNAHCNGYFDWLYCIVDDDDYLDAFCIQFAMQCNEL